MKKRLRKKLHRGEFRELGFSFDAKFKADTEMQVVEAWLQELASLLNSHSLEMGGGWNSNVCGGFITRERGSVTPEEQDIVRKWFDEHGQNLESITVGGLKDAWYGWLINTERCSFHYKILLFCLRLGLYLQPQVCKVLVGCLCSTSFQG